MPTPETAPRPPRLFDRAWKRARKWKHYPLVTYQIIAFLTRGRSEWRFMNYGFAALDGTEPELPQVDARERYSAQLYHFLGSGADLAGKQGLEIGSGRGGGSSLLHRHFKPREMTGLDFSSQAVEFCRRTYREEGLDFVVGDAMNLAFPDNRFDVILNLESAHCYPDPDRFVGEVFRTLRPGGRFVYSDVLPQHMYGAVRPRLEAAGFTVTEERDISPEVLNALDRDSARRRSLAKAWAPWFLRDFAGLFAGVQGSYPYERLRSGQSRYFRFLATKPAPGTAPLAA